MSLTGQVSLTYEGQVYPLTINYAAMCIFEEETGKNCFSMLRLLSQGGVNAGLITARELRALFYGGLKAHAADMTIDLAGRILDANPEMLLKALGVALPKEGDTPPVKAKAGKTHRPRRRRAKK